MEKTRKDKVAIKTKLNQLKLEHNQKYFKDSKKSPKGKDFDNSVT